MSAERRSDRSVYAKGTNPATYEGEGSEEPVPSLRSTELPVGVWLLAPVLALLIPGLVYQWLFRVYAVRTTLYVSMTVIVAVFTVVTWALLHFLAFNRDIRRSTGVAAVIVPVVFLWPPWTAMGDGAAGLTRIGLLADIVPVLATGGLLWAAVRYADRDRFVIVLVGVLIGMLIVLGYEMAPRVVRASDVSLPALSPGPNPNVVVLVLDGYARADVLSSQYGFDNSAFLDALTERGFQIRDDAVTNYSVTHVSLPSMVDMDYPFEEGVLSNASLDHMRQLLSGDATLMHAFESAGYETLMFENAWPGSNCGGVPDRCHRTGLLSHSVWALGKMSPFAPIQRSTVPQPYTAIGLQHIRELGDVIDDDASAPIFTLAHVTVPHPPTQLEASCEFVVASDRVGMLLWLADATEEERMEGRSRYVDQMQCINSEVIATVDRLLAADDDIEIVIVSDHGPDARAQITRDVVDWTDEDLLERLSVLSAIRMPGTCTQREPARTTVNTIRRSVACALGTDVIDLPDRIFAWGTVQEVGLALVDVTDRMNSISALDE